ncbi:MAG: hypothetical protein ABIR94_06175 [Rubrivivax sp.]
MRDVPQFLYLFVDHPTLIAIPIAFFAGLALWSRSVTVWAAVGAWNLYLIYELGMKAEEFCSGIACMKRTPLYGAYPALGLLSLVALVQGYVHIRDRHYPKQVQPAATSTYTGH